MPLLVNLAQRMGGYNSHKIRDDIHRYVTSTAKARVGQYLHQPDVNFAHNIIDENVPVAWRPPLNKPYMGE